MQTILDQTAACCFVMAIGMFTLPGVEHSWRGLDSTGVFPANDLVTEFWDLPADFDMAAIDPRKAKPPAGAQPGTKKNIVWRVTLPHWGHNAPVVMGNQVYLLSEEGWKSDAPELVCIDVVRGEILWQRPVDHLDAWPTSKAEAAKKVRAREIKRWQEHFTWWNKLYWNNESDWVSKHDQATWEKIRAEAKAAGWEFCDFATRRSPKQRGNAGLRGRYGRKTARDQGAPIDKSLSDNFFRCGEEKIYFREGWTSEGPWYGSTMGSVVTDGESIYALTALGGLAAYKPDGTRRWVTDIGFQVGAKGTLPCHDSFVHYRMSSPVLANGHVVYYDRDSAYMYAFDCADGTLAWKTRPPGEKNAKGRFVARGHGFHMAPGGTPVVMDIEGVSIVVSCHGVAFRLSDGALLGQVELPVAGKKGTRTYGSTYNSWAAEGDVLYGHNGQVFAIRLGLKGDSLTQQVLWKTEGACDASGREPNLIVDGDLVYIPRLKGGPMGDSGRLAVDKATGKPKYGLRGGGHWGTAVGVGKKVMVAKGGGIKLKTFMGGAMSYAVCSKKDGNLLGVGLLAVERPAGDVQARHIAFQGMPTINWGASGITCWGNRIFIRNNDYLWCIGDPKQAWIPPEQCGE